MGAIGGMLGLGGGAAGTGFSKPGQADITVPVDQNAANAAAARTNTGLNSQEALLAALAGQNGINNQSNVYNQLQGVAAGTGPNPAQAMLNQATGANIANQAALAAGQRGAAGNVGLMARQVGQQGGALQQTAAGQGATMQANQALNAISAAGNMANNQVANQIGATTANAQATQSNQANILNAINAANQNKVSSQNSVNQANAGLAQTTMGAQKDVVGGLMQAVGPVLGSLARGGDVKRMADGGPVSTMAPTPMPMIGPQNDPGLLIHGSAPITINSTPAYSGVSDFGNFIFQKSVPAAAPTVPVNTDNQNNNNKNQNSALAEGSKAMGQGIIKAFSSAAPTAAAAAARGGMTHDYRSGGHVQAKSAKEKAVKPGNDYANDKIPAVLSEHEIVIPRSVTLSKDPVNASAKFVAAVIAKRKGKK